jgi:hypothetical protein
MMSATTTQALNIRYNAGLERGRKHQERGGYLIPSFVMYLPEAEARAYETGWSKGYDTVTPLCSLRRAV